MNKNSNSSTGANSSTSVIGVKYESGYVMHSLQTVVVIAAITTRELQNKSVSYSKEHCEAEL